MPYGQKGRQDPYIPGVDHQKWCPLLRKGLWVESMGDLGIAQMSSMGRGSPLPPKKSRGYLIMGKKIATQKIGRDATTGKFIPVAKAEKDPKHTTVEKIKRPSKKK